MSTKFKDLQRQQRELVRLRKTLGARRGEFYRGVGEEIRRKRLKARMTQGELAELVGLNRTSITNIEAGVSRILLHVLCSIAVACECSPSDLLP